MTLLTFLDIRSPKPFKTIDFIDFYWFWEPKPFKNIDFIDFYWFRDSSAPGAGQGPPIKTWKRKSQ